MDSNVQSPDGGKLFCRLEEVAVPEVHSDKYDIDEVESEEDEAISYDTVAVPEIHLKACRIHC